MAILLFEDSDTPQLDPVALTKPAFAISCGGTCLLDELEKFDTRILVAVRPHLRALVQENHPNLVEFSGAIDEPTLCVNARLVPSVSTVSKLSTLRASGAALGDFDGTVAAGVCAADTKLVVDNLKPAKQCHEWPLLNYPHDVVRHHLASFANRLAEIVSSNEIPQIADGVFAQAGVTISDSVEFDTRDGAIILCAGASVGPFSLLEGPLLIEDGAKILPHSQIKDATHIGRACKVGGEVEASIIERYSNKQHHGFLGHAYVGSWVNLGAGTTNSDLKNTYGMINVDYGDGKLSTEMQFLGCILGDYVKTAINSSIYTGKVIGPASMLYGTVAQNVPAFVNYARDLGSETVITPEVVIKMQQRMFARRQVAHRDCDAQLIRDLFELTTASRGQLKAEPPTF